MMHRVSTSGPLQRSTWTTTDSTLIYPVKFYAPASLSTKSSSSVDFFFLIRSCSKILPIIVHSSSTLAVQRIRSSCLLALLERCFMMRPCTARDRLVIGSATKARLSKMPRRSSRSARHEVHRYFPHLIFSRFDKSMIARVEFSRSATFFPD